MLKAQQACKMRFWANTIWHVDADTLASLILTLASISNQKVEDLKVDIVEKRAPLPGRAPKLLPLHFNSIAALIHANQLERFTITRGTDGRIFLFDYEPPIDGENRQVPHHPGWLEIGLTNIPRDATAALRQVFLDIVHLLRPEYAYCTHPGEYPASQASLIDISERFLSENNLAFIRKWGGNVQGQADSRFTEQHATKVRGVYWLNLLSNVHLDLVGPDNLMKMLESLKCVWLNTKSALLVELTQSTQEADRFLNLCQQVLPSEH